MLSDAGFTFAHHTVTSLQLLGLGALLLGIAVFLLAFSRERRTSLKHSDVTDNLMLTLGRIAYALERIADNGSHRMDGAAKQELLPAPTGGAKRADVSQEAPPEHQRIAYSIFGR